MRIITFTLILLISFLNGSSFAISQHKKIIQYQTLVEKKEHIKEDLDYLENLSSKIRSFTYMSASLIHFIRKTAEISSDRKKKILSLEGFANPTFEAKSLAIDSFATYLSSVEKSFENFLFYAAAEDDRENYYMRLADETRRKVSSLKKEAKENYKEALFSTNQFNTHLKKITRLHVQFNRELISLNRKIVETEKNRREIAIEVTKKNHLFTPELYKLLSQKKSLPLDTIRQQTKDITTSDKAHYQKILSSLQEIQAEEEASINKMKKLYGGVTTVVVLGRSYFFLQYFEQDKDVDRVSSAIDTVSEKIEEAKDHILYHTTNNNEIFASFSPILNNLPDHVQILQTLEKQALLLRRNSERYSSTLQEIIDKKRSHYLETKKMADKAYYSAYGKNRYPEALGTVIGGMGKIINQSNVYQSANVALGSKELASATGESISINDHIFTKVSVFEDEPKKYGAYTYVLFRQNYEFAQPHIKERYKALLEAVYRSTSSIDHFSAPIPPKKLNLFCIPCKKDESSYHSGGVCKNYDTDLSRSYLSTAGSGALLRKRIKHRIRKSPGPFLLTTRTPLSEGNPGKQLLFVDLSGFEAENFDSVISEYKNSVVEEPPMGQEIWTPPATQRVVYAGVSISTAIPELAEKIKKVMNFFVPAQKPKPAGTSG